jgi:hypothetical protein
MDHARSSSLSAPLNAKPKIEHDPITAHICIQVRAGILSIRDAVSSDVEAYVNYWHYSGEKIKDVLGIDREKLGTPEDSRERFYRMIRVPSEKQVSVIFTVTLNAHVIGYTNINRYGLDEEYLHLHTYRSSVRSALRDRKITHHTKSNTSLASVLIGYIINMYFDLFPLRRVILPTRTTNRWINHALELYMPPAETLYLNAPAGLAAPNEYHLRYVYRDRARWMRNRAELINNGLITESPIRANRIGLHGRAFPLEHTSPSVFT